MLKELVHEKINEVFLEYQKANNIVSGDIDPFDAEYLDRLEEQLTQHIERVCAKQPRENYDKLAPSWYIYTDSEGIAHSETFGVIGMDMFFGKVSNRIAYDDITGDTVQKIYFQGKEVEYAGWQSGMTFEYKDLDGNTVWVEQFEEWDH